MYTGAFLLESGTRAADCSLSGSQVESAASGRDHPGSSCLRTSTRPWRRCGSTRCGRLPSTETRTPHPLSAVLLHTTRAPEPLWLNRLWEPHFGTHTRARRDLLRVRRCAECGILGCCLATSLFSKFVGRGLRSASGAPSHMLYTLPAEGRGHGSRAAALARLVVFRLGTQGSR